MEAVGGTGEGEGDEQAHQTEDGAINGTQPRLRVFAGG